MTVARMEQEMPNREYIGWQVFLGRRAQHKQMEAMRGKVR